MPELLCVMALGCGSGAGRDRWHPRVSGKGVADGGEDGDSMLGGGGGVSAYRVPVAGCFLRAEPTGVEVSEKADLGARSPSLGTRSGSTGSTSGSTTPASMPAGSVPALPVSVLPEVPAGSWPAGTPSAGPRPAASSPASVMPIACFL